MPALNFQACFADKVERFEKRNTIRKNQRCKVGETVYLYTGMRTKKCRKLGEGICTEVFKIHICRDGINCTKGEGLQAQTFVFVTEPALDAFARKDGFKDWLDMREWFNHQYGLPVSGWWHAWKPKDMIYDVVITTENFDRKKKIVIEMPDDFYALRTQPIKDFPHHLMDEKQRHRIVIDAILFAGGMELIKS